MSALFIDRAREGADNPNVVSLAVRDLNGAAAILRKSGGVVRGLDVRELDGGARMLARGPVAFDRYTMAIDAGLAKLPGLTNRGYTICRVEETTRTR